MSIVIPPLLCLLLGQCPTTTVPPAVCSVPNCHVFKDGSLVLFVGKLDVDLKEPSTTVCNPFGGNIFIPRTMEDNQIWLEFTRKIYNESSSFDVIFYPVIYYSGENPYWKWYGDTGTFEVLDSDYRLSVNFDYETYPSLDSYPYKSVDSEGNKFIAFVSLAYRLDDKLRFQSRASSHGYAVCTPQDT